MDLAILIAKSSALVVVVYAGLMALTLGGMIWLAWNGCDPWSWHDQ